MSFSSQLMILHDFSSDKESLLAAAIASAGRGSELAEGAAADETLEDTGAAFTADSSGSISSTRIASSARSKM